MQTIRRDNNQQGGAETMHKGEPESKPSNAKLELRPASYGESDLFYSMPAEDDLTLGCVGHVCMEFGRNGGEFRQAWYPRGEEAWDTPAFQAELQAVVDALRQSVLKDLKAMARYCEGHGGAIQSRWTQSYGYIVETAHYRYCLRCNPSPSDENCYLTAFNLDVQRQNAAQARAAMKDDADTPRQGMTMGGM